MGANNHKVVNAINVIQSLPDRVVGSAQTLKAMFDNVGEIVRLKHNDLCDYIDNDIATKSEVSGVILGQIVDGTITEPKLDTALQTKLIAINPTGSIVAMAVSTVPNGYLECDGSAISRTTYSTLFSVLGELYGVGDGSTTFNLPDLRGQFLRGWDNGKGIDTGRSIGTTQNGTKWRQNSGSNDANAFAGQVDGTTDPDFTVRPRNISVMYCIKY